MAQITLKGISKRFTVYERDSGRKNPFARRRRVVEALKEMSFSIERGELVGYIGPNGAGKTTTVKLLNGMLAPSQGKIRVLGLDPAKQPEKPAGTQDHDGQHLPLRDFHVHVRHIAQAAAVADVDDLLAAQL